MTDETKPKRQRGQKEREAAYRAGFLDGLVHAHGEMQAKQAIEGRRDGAVAEGLKRLQDAPPVPKRTRRKRRDDENGVTANPDVVRVS